MNEDIITKRCLLRKYNPEDKDTVADFFTNDIICRFMGDGVAESRQDAYSLFDKVLEIYDGLLAPRHFEVWGIEYESEVIGHVELKSTEHTGINELEIVYLIDEPYWGKGIIPEILEGLKLHAKEMNKIVIATVKPINHASIRALEKVGIQKLLQYKDTNYLKITLKP